MTDYKKIIISFLSTAVLIAGLAAFVAYKNGEIDRMTAADKYADVPVPLTPTKENETADANAVATPNTTSEANNQVSNETNTMPSSNPVVTFKTTKGDVSLEIFMDKMPITAGNFIKLAKDGFYNGTKFHRVIDGFMVQGGDPNSKADDTSKYGTGGPGYAIKDEFVAGLSNVRGTISMANSGPNTGGSQFFINLVDNTFLDFDKSKGGKHPVFGKVISGMDIADAISKVPRDTRDLPLDAIIISSVEVK